jgi:hypothetical protein
MDVSSSVEPNTSTSVRSEQKPAVRAAYREAAARIAEANMSAAIARETRSERIEVFPVVYGKVGAAIRDARLLLAFG